MKSEINVQNAIKQINMAFLYADTLSREVLSCLINPHFNQAKTPHSTSIPDTNITQADNGKSHIHGSLNIQQ